MVETTGAKIITMEEIKEETIIIIPIKITIDTEIHTVGMVIMDKEKEYTMVPEKNTKNSVFSFFSCVSFVLWYTKYLNKFKKRKLEKTFILYFNIVFLKILF